MHMFAQLKTVESIQRLISTWEHAAVPAVDDPLQPLLLGLNTYINHDLVFELANNLAVNGDTLTPQGRQRDRRAFDGVIAAIKTLVMDVYQRVSERGCTLDLDVWVLEDLIDGWSETVWKHTEALLRSRSQFEAEAIRFQVDRRTIKRAEGIRCARLNRRAEQAA